MKARRRIRSQEAPLVDERFRADTDDAEPASRTQLLVSAAPLTFDSVPPYLGSAVPSNELAPLTPRSSEMAVSSPAPTSIVPSALPSSIDPSAAAPVASPASKARMRGWLLLTPALLFGVASVILALKLVLAPAHKPAASSPVTVIHEAAESSPPAAEKAPPIAEAVVPAEDDGLEIIETPEETSPTKAANSWHPQQTSRPQTASPRAGAPKKEPSSPVIF